MGFDGDEIIERKKRRAAQKSSKKLRKIKGGKATFKGVSFNQEKCCEEGLGTVLMCPETVIT